MLISCRRQKSISDVSEMCNWCWHPHTGLLCARDPVKQCAACNRGGPDDVVHHAPRWMVLEACLASDGDALDYMASNHKLGSFSSHGYQTNSSAPAMWNLRCSKVPRVLVPTVLVTMHCVKHLQKYKS